MAHELPRRDVLKAGGAGVVGVGLLAAVDTLPAFAETASSTAIEPKVFRTSDPVAPGEVAVLFGGGMGATTSVQFSVPGGPAGQPGQAGSFSGWQTIQTFQASENSVKFVVPKGIRPGVYAVNYGGAHPALINRPVVHWLQATRLATGMVLNEAPPGADIQLIGRQLTLGDAGGSGSGAIQVSLIDSAGKTSRLMVRKANPYSTVVALPASLAPGAYRISVHNGGGGVHGWSEPLAFTVKNPTAWPSRVFNIKDYGAKGDDQTDDSTAFRQVLAAAKANGGGVVYLPYGTYRLNGWFLLPEYVTLRGEGRDLSALKWPQQIPARPEEISEAVIYAAGNWAMEKLSISAGKSFGMIYDLSWASTRDRLVAIPELQQYVKPYHTTRDIFLRDVRISNNIYQGRPRENDPRVPMPGLGDYRDNCIWANGVTNLEISDCEFTGSLKLNDVRSSRITGSTFGEGFFPLGWVDLGGQYAIFEKNTLRGIVGSWNTDFEPVLHTYIAENWIETIMGGFREGMVSDANRLVTKSDNFNMRSAWNAMVGSVTGTTLNLVDVEQFAFGPDKFATFDIMISDGRGAGQVRKVVHSGATTVEIDRPWDVDPDATSMVLIFRLQGYLTYYDNYCQNSSTLAQLYGSYYDCIISSNKTRRTQGSWALWGWFCQWIGNDVDNALIFHSGTGPGGYAGERTPEGSSPFGFLGYVVKGNLTPGDNPSPQDPRPPKIPYTYVRGAAFKRNKLAHGNRILVMFGFGSTRTDKQHIAIQDVVVSGNEISDATVGVEFDQNVYRSVVHNTKAHNVGTPIKLWDPAKVTVID